MLNELLFTIPKDKHDPKDVIAILEKHPEVKFVSLVGIDIGGHETDEKIPVRYFTKKIQDFYSHGVQTDGSSAVLPKIAELNNARVDIIPDQNVNWYVDYNFSFNDTVSQKERLPVGTLRIPSFLVHNDVHEVGSRVILKNSLAFFKKEVSKAIQENPYIFEHLGIKSHEEIEEIVLTAATELEFWVKTPDDKADREQLSTSQVLKEQYWKRTIGPVRTALEKSILMLERYGIEVEMGHKEVGGVKAKLGNSGEYDHVMEQLEIDWKYDDPMQAADNVNHVKYIVKDVFRMHGLQVSFMAKPIEYVAGSGEHTHMGVAARLKNGKTINLFSPQNEKEDFMNPLGFGALMGLLKNYEILNPFITASNDAFNRLKPGFEAPVCIVTSLGMAADSPSRNRTVLMGLVRDMFNPMSTRFELRSPNPKSNTYLVMAASYMAMLDGIKSVLKANKSPKDLEKSISKTQGQEDFYLERDRVYRSEENVFTKYSEEERNQLFGKAPGTVWENIRAFDLYTEKLNVLFEGKGFEPLDVESYKEAILSQWSTELTNRIIPNNMNTVKACVMLHDSGDYTDLDERSWEVIQTQRMYLMKDSIAQKSLFSRVKDALSLSDYDTASRLQIEMQDKIQNLIDLYLEYKRNLF